MLKHRATQAPAASRVQDADREADVQLTAMVPRSVRQSVLRHAADHGTTVRSVILRLLKDARIAHIDESEITDRRAAPRHR